MDEHYIMQTYENLQLSIDDHRHFIHCSKIPCAGYTGIIKHRISSELATHFTATFYLPQNIDFRYDLDKAIQEGRKKGKGRGQDGVKTVNHLWEKHVAAHHAESCRWTDGQVDK